MTIKISVDGRRWRFSTPAAGQPFACRRRLRTACVYRGCPRWLNRRPGGGRTSRPRRGPVLGVGSATGGCARQRADADAVTGRSFVSLEEVETPFGRWTGPPTSQVSAQPIMGASMAAAQASALESGQPLSRWLTPRRGDPAAAGPHFNVVTGVARGERLDFQEFMIAPIGARRCLKRSLPASRCTDGCGRCWRNTALRRVGDEGGSRRDRLAGRGFGADGARHRDAGYATGRDGVAMPRSGREQISPDASYRWPANRCRART